MNIKYLKYINIILITVSVIIFTLPIFSINATTVICPPNTSSSDGKNCDLKKLSNGRICNLITNTIQNTNEPCPVEYFALEPNAFPGVSQASTGNLTSFLSAVFSFGIAAAIALALIMIIWGGMIKMTTDSWQGKDDAKSKITNAIYGLGLALISWLLLYTINPCLVQFTATSDGCKASNTLLK